MSKQLKIGIIGAGAIVESCHIPVLLNHQHFSLEWIYDYNISKAKTLAAMYGLPKVLKQDEWKSALEKIDGCILAIPYGARKEYIETIAAQNKFLYVEKPFARSEKEHKYLCNLFPEYAISVGFQRRMYATVWQLKSIIENGLFGQIKKIRFVHGNFTLKGGSGYISNPELSGGGFITESVIHFLDQILLFTGTKAFTINKKRLFQSKGIEYDADFQALLDLDSGVQCGFESEISTLRNLDNGLTLIFDQAEIECELNPQSKILVRKNNEKFYITSQVIENKHADNVMKAFSLFWSEFYNALQNKTPNLSSGITNIQTTAFVEKLYE